MRAVRYCVATGLVLLLAVGLLWGQQGRNRGNRADRPDRMGMDFALQRIQRLLETLELTDEQKQTIEAFRVEYTEKVEPLTAKMREQGRAMRDRMQNDPDDAEGLAKMRQEMTEATAALRKLGEEFSEKVKGVLTEEQKKQFDEAVAQGPGGALVDRALRGIAPVDFRILRDLELTDEQRQKYQAQVEEYQAAIEKLRAEYEAKFVELLTDEQKKKYEELKANPPQMDRAAMRQQMQNRRQQRQGGGQGDPGGQAPPPDAF